MVSTEMPLRDLPALSSGLDLRSRLTVLRRRLFVLLAFLVASLITGAVISIHAPRIYRSTATVLIDVNTPDVLNGVRAVYDAGASYWASKEYYQTQYNIIGSRLVAQRVAHNLGLEGAALLAEVRAALPESADPRLRHEPLQDLPPVLHSKLKMLGLGGLMTRDSLLKKLENIDPVSIVQARVKTEPVRESRLVQISIEDNDAVIAAIIANAVADAYIEVNLDQRVDMSRSALDWLTDQMQSLKTKVEQSEVALFDFRKGHNMASISMEDRQAMIAQRLTLLNQSLTAARSEGLAMESRRDQVDVALRQGQVPDGFQEVMNEPLVQKLKSNLSDLRQEEADLAMRYTQEHPKLQTLRQKIALVQAEMAGEIDKVVMSLHRRAELSSETQRRLQQEINKVTLEASDLGQIELQYNRLNREKENYASLFDVILKREKEANLTQMLKLNNVRKLDAARAAAKPIRPNVKLNMLASLLLGVLGGAAVAFVVDYLDNSVKSQDQIENVIGLPFLGIVPQVKVGKTQNKAMVADRDWYALNHPRSAPAECWRTIRTNIMFMSPENPARTIVVSSSAPLEGKTTTAINVAVTMALLGTRTLLIDTDMRRPRLHKTFGVKNEVGVSTLIVSDCAMDDAIQPSAVERLDLLTCGPIPPNPAELLHTDRFRALLKKLSEKYQHIILDSPPVAAVTDALVLASIVDGVVLVAQAGQSTWQATLQTKRRFEDVGARMFGVVLNSVDLDRRAGADYYYYRYYHYGENLEA